MDNKKELKTANHVPNERGKEPRLVKYLLTLATIIIIGAGLFLVTSNSLSIGRIIETGTLFSLGRSGCCGDRDASANDKALPAETLDDCCRIDNTPLSSENKLAAEALEYYQINFGATDDLQARVEDFGCHQEIIISRNNQLVKRFSYFGGTFYDLTP